MRRPLPLALMALCLLATVPAIAAEVEPIGGQERFALAMWTRPTSDPQMLTGYLVVAHDQEGLSGPGFWSGLIIAKGPCRVLAKDRLRCTADSGRGYRIRSGELQIDPTLGGATLRAERGEFIHEVTWRGSETPGPGWSAGIGDGGLEYQHREFGLSAARPAKASGDLFGERLSSRFQRGPSWFSTGAYAGFVYWNDDNTIALDEGRVQFDLGAIR